MLVLLLVRELLNSGVNPDLVNEDGLTALHQVHTHTHIHTEKSSPTSGNKLVMAVDSVANLKILNSNIKVI